MVKNQQDLPITFHIKRYRLFLELPKKLLKITMFRYFVIAPIGASIDVLIFMLLLEHNNYPWLEASVISSILSTLVGYFLSIIFVFQSGSKYKMHQELFGVLVISFFAFILHQALMYLFIEVLKVNFLFSKIISIGIIFLFNYFSRSKFIFSSFKN